MKIYLLILFCLLYSCNNITHSESVLQKSDFEGILEEIHLAEATYKLNRNINLDAAEKKLSATYSSIYEKYNISESDLEKSINYYSKNPEELEKIYSNILQRLINEKASFDQQ